MSADSLRGCEKRLQGEQEELLFRKLSGKKFRMGYYRMLGGTVENLPLSDIRKENGRKFCQ